ncbi:MAG: ATP-dependent helicase [Nevskiaceae bacterium]|nr:MAG: ATP-dependent helicase [Nevskiaceae bacterium]
MEYAEEIYGPPGCGKTTYQMNVITNLIAEGFHPDRIAFLSHTRAAAGEALSRLNMTRSDKVSTIHSLAYRMLGMGSTSLVNHTRLQEFSAKIGVPIKNGSIDSDEGIEIGDEYLGIMNKARNSCRHPDDEYQESSRPGSLPQFQAFVKGFAEWKKANGYVDFTDMLERFLLWAEHNKLPRFEADGLIIDEAQDLSVLQWRVIDILCSQVRRVYISGDDDQAIYVWGGADPKGMVRFGEKYGAQRRVLSQSYRVPKAVQAVALDIIHRVGHRVDKEYAPRAENGIVNRYGYIDSLTVAHGEDALFLCRTGAQKKEVEKWLLAEGVPYLMEGGKPGLYQTKAANAIRAFKKLQRGDSISATEMQHLEAAIQRQHRDLVVARQFEDLLKKDFWKVIDIPSWHMDFYRQNDVDVAPTIRVSSIHGAKGREAERVVLHTGMTDRVADGMERDPDAEHRVFYVGSTRAKHQLDIVDGNSGYQI